MNSEALDSTADCRVEADPRMTQANHGPWTCRSRLGFATALVVVGCWTGEVKAAEPAAPLGARSGAELTTMVPAPTRLLTRAGDRSVVLHWDAVRESGVTGYRVARRPAGGGTWSQLTPTPVWQTGFADLEATNDVVYEYVVRAVTAGGESADSSFVRVTPRPFASDAEFLELVQATAFDYFWHEANPTNGLVRDRSTRHSFCSVAAVGFGLTALGIGIDHGWITRAEGRDRALVTLRTFWEKPQGDAAAGTIGYKGWFYHFLDMDAGLRFNPQIELSSIDTALFLAGALYAREYFDGDHPDERRIRELADAIYGRIDWNWMANGGQTLTMGWLPGKGFLKSRWTGYNEASLLYLLGLGAERDPLPASAWSAWTGTYKWETHYGQSFVPFPPLFGHQYTQCWIDLREVADVFMRRQDITYFENSRRATLAQRAYAVANPGGFAGYGANLWGFTACDGPKGYAARGAPPPENDDGTIAPTAAGGSFAFTPAESLAALRGMYEAYRPRLWTPYGFRDAFNLQADWWGPDVLGIDQGPILLMIENHRTQRVWQKLQRSSVVQRGLQRAGFEPRT